MNFGSGITATVSAILAESKVIKICGNCKYYKDRYCFRFPPTPLVDDDAFYHERPGVDPDDFCGEFNE